MCANATKEINYMEVGAENRVRYCILYYNDSGVYWVKVGEPSYVCRKQASIIST